MVNASLTVYINVALLVGSWCTTIAGMGHVGFGCSDPVASGSEACPFFVGCKGYPFFLESYPLIKKKYHNEQLKAIAGSKFIILTPGGWGGPNKNILVILAESARFIYLYHPLLGGIFPRILYPSLSQCSLYRLLQ